MCGIVGYIGRRNARPVLLDCLGRLEYRGYDSCGVAIAGDTLEVFKDAVRVRALARSLPSSFNGKAGIGHTRWATHGEPSKVNAHPQVDCAGRIAVVHNGVINNFQELRDSLTAEGHKLVSQTDTEVIPHLIEKYFEGDFEVAVTRALEDIHGSYTMIAVMADQPALVAARKDSPLIIGVGDGENFLASDVPALLDYTSRVIYLEDGDVAIVSAGGVSVKNGGSAIDREEHKILWNVEDAQKAGYEHFMLKEIHEQPKVIRDTLGEYISAKAPDELAGEGGGLGDVLILACGTSYHAGLVGKYIIEGLVNVPVRVELADEFNYSGQATAGNRAIVVTQSGETTDVLKAIRKLKDTGCRVTAITNVVGSTVSRHADRTLYTRAGPEISVAATKTFLAQLIAFYWLALPYSKVDISHLDDLIREIRQLPVKVQQVLDREDEIAELARELAGYENIFFIGKGINYPVALEGALKLKEISYIHAEGYAAGELKHGPFALLGEKTPVLAVVARDNTHEPMVTSIKEVKARNSPVLALVSEDDDAMGGLASVALQLLAYFTARERGCPIDFPRNLAKSVTVE
jgi:glucosamine--fructose-6-phosphate aminotransferase (isomerizing)